jgi:hypothetical protein
LSPEIQKVKSISSTHFLFYGAIMTLSYFKHEKIILKNQPDFDEKWLQSIISEDPSILGLGELTMKDIERPLAYGRLDLLLKDDDTNTRYEVEIQLGKVDESHIIRTIEYWDEERSRYPQFEHVAVIIAEEINTRFLNVISLFNKSIPIIAIQLNALKLDNKVVLNFTKVLDLIEHNDDEVDSPEPSDRSYWIKRSSEEVLKVADYCLELLAKSNPSISFNYNKGYIGIKVQNRANNMVLFWPKKGFLRIASKNNNRDEWLNKLKEVGIVTFGERKSQRVHFKITLNELKNNEAIVEALLREAYQDNRNE